MNKSKIFFVLWSDDEPVSNWKYYDEDEAVSEAQRLNKENPGVGYYVLKSHFLFKDELTTYV